MENATKALLIAAAILIAILIISLSLVVYRMASETMGSVNLSEAEMAAFNGKFEPSSGNRKSGATVNGLLTTVMSHNRQAASSGEPTVTVVDNCSSGAAVNMTTGTITKVKTGAYFAIDLTYDADGLVSTITINTPR